MTKRTDDYDEIKRVMQLYIDGFNDHDIDKFKEAFDENAWIYYIDAEGKLIKYLIADRLEAWASPDSRIEARGPVVGRIISVTQVGDAASVQISFDRALHKSEGWIDFHNLIRVSGVWKITNKTATHSSR